MGAYETEMCALHPVAYLEAAGRGFGFKPHQKPEFSLNLLEYSEPKSEQLLWNSRLDTALPAPLQSCIFLLLRLINSFNISGGNACFFILADNRYVKSIRKIPGNSRTFNRPYGEPRFFYKRKPFSCANINLQIEISYSSANTNTKFDSTKLIEKYKRWNHSLWSYFLLPVFRPFSVR